MAYRKQTRVSRDVIERSMDSISSDILSIGVHPVVIKEVTVSGDVLKVTFNDTLTNIYCKIDTYLFNSLLAAVSFADRDLLWELKNDHNFQLLQGLKLKAVVGVGWGATIIKQDRTYLVVDTKTCDIVLETDEIAEACKKRDELGRAYLNVYKCLPHSKEAVKKKTEDKIKSLARRLKGK